MFIPIIEVFFNGYIFFISEIQSFKNLSEKKRGDTWVAQLVQCLTSAQVMISWFVGSSPASGSVLTAQSLEPASDCVSLSLSAPPLLTLCLSFSQKQTFKKKNGIQIRSNGFWIVCHNYLLQGIFRVTRSTNIY